MHSDRPTFTVVTPADEDARRFIDLAVIRSLTGIPSTGEGALDDTALGLQLDAVLADSADYCRLASDGAHPITLAQEVVRATYVDETALGYSWPRIYRRGHQLFLPWRAPITAIEITEGATQLVRDTDFRLLGAGVVERLSGGNVCGWSTSNLVVTYTAGWLADDEDNPVPANLVARIADQVRLLYFQGRQNPTLRSQDVPGVWSGTYSVAGGDTISEEGRLSTLEGALKRFRGPPSFA